MRARGVSSMGQLRPCPHVRRHVMAGRRDPAVSNVAYRPPKMAIRAEAVVISDGIATNYHSVDIAIEPAFLAAPCNGFVVRRNAHPRRGARQIVGFGGRLCTTTVYDSDRATFVLNGDSR